MEKQFGLKPAKLKFYTGNGGRYANGHVRTTSKLKKRMGLLFVVSFFIYIVIYEQLFTEGK